MFKTDYQKEYLEESIPKHRKKSTGTKTKKSSHKHCYESFYMWNPTSGKKQYRFAGVYQYCTICGRIGNRVGDMLYKTENGYFAFTTIEKAYDKYGVLPSAIVDILSKRVDLEHMRPLNTDIFNEKKINKEEK